MSKQQSRLLTFFFELKRRHVTKVACVYGLVGIGIVEAVNNFFPLLNVPAWTQTFVAALVLLGLPVAAVIAWAFEVTPDGLRRTQPADETPQPAQRAQWLPHTIILTSLALAMGVWMAFRSRDAIVRSEDAGATIAVLPFTIRARDELSYLGEGMVDLLSRKLDGAGRLRTTDPVSTMKLAAEAGVLTPPIARALAQQLGAEHFILGTIYEVAGRLRIEASLYSAEATARAPRQESVEGPTSDIFALVDELTRELMVQQKFGKAAERLAQTAGLTTTSLPALHAYLAGEHAFRATKMADAIEAFQRATQEDTAFALAYYRLATVYWWADPVITGPEKHQLSRQAAERALVHEARLSERDRRLVRAFVALHRGAVNEAEEAYLKLIADHPDDMEAQFQYADLLHHWNAPRGRSMHEAREPFAQVLAADPEFACPI